MMNRSIDTNRYPFSDIYDYETYIETINFDEECKKDIENNNGFIIEPFKSIKKDLKAINGIFSPKFGQTLSDVNPYMDRYKCTCGAVRGRLNHGLMCPQCNTRCEFVDDNFSYFGWLELDDPFVCIHPAYYKKIESFFGKSSATINGVKRSKLENIIDIVDNKDINGESVELTDDQKPKNEPFFGIGMIDFVKRFDEIMDYYDKKNTNPNKKIYYDDIYEHIDYVFTHHIPVFSTLLRPTDIKDGTMSYEPTNAMYMMMNKLVTVINKNKSFIDRNPKVKNQTLYRLQTKFMELYGELELILSGKKGDIRSLIGGRYNFSSRNVIVQNPDLRIDQVTLPYVALVIMLEQRIKNVLHRLYNFSFAEAHDIWSAALNKPDPRIEGIIQSIIDEYKKRDGFTGLPVIINRNPTIAYGGILQMFCVGFTHTYTMGVPLQPLPLLAADFDGDVLNIMLPMMMEFVERAFMIFNPRNAMYISRNDGYFNTAVSMQRDTLINANTLSSLGDRFKTDDEKNDLLAIIKRNESFFM